jgi:L-fuculose-phosphate aldolase
MDEAQARRDMAEVGRLLYERGLLASRDGNLSIRLGADRVLTTPAGTCKGHLDPVDMVVVDGRGEPLSEGAARPSTEIKMHLAVYPVRPDAGAIVHAHPPAATAYAVARVPIDEPALAEVVYNLGCVPVAEYALPSTQRLADTIAQHIGAHQALLLANHGVLAVGTDIWDAYYRMEGVEHFARILLYAAQLGGARRLGAEQVDELCELRRSAGVTAPNPLCDAPPQARPLPRRPPREIVEKVTREVVAQLLAAGAGAAGSRRV